MAVHHGGKLGKAAKTLASKSASKKAKKCCWKDACNSQCAKKGAAYKRVEIPPGKA